MFAMSLLKDTLQKIKTHLQLSLANIAQVGFAFIIVHIKII